MATSVVNKSGVGAKEKTILGIALAVSAFLLSYGYDLAKIGGVYGFLLAALDFGIAFVIAFVAYLPFIKIGVPSDQFEKDLADLQARVVGVESKVSSSDLAEIKKFLPVIEQLIANNESKVVDNQKVIDTPKVIEKPKA